MSLVVAHRGAADGTVGESMRVTELCQCFEEMINPDRDRNSRPKILKKLWENYGYREHGLFPLMRLILPHLDSERPQYKLKQRSLAKMYVQLLALNESSEAAQTLLNWKRPSAGFQRNEQGNFPEVVQSVIKGRCTMRKGDLTIGELNDRLDALATRQGDEQKMEVISDLHHRTTAQEQRWILRIILKDMHIAMKEDSVFQLLHPDARELYNSNCNLRATCEQCVDPNYRLSQIEISPFTPFRPRLAAKATHWAHIHKILSKKGDYVAEYKLDGERLLLHFRRGAARDRSDDRAEWWTRNCKNFTSGYGAADPSPSVSASAPPNHRHSSTYYCSALE